MSITAKFYSLFDSRIRNRGQSYFNSRGTVRLKHADANRVEATVVGSEYYKINLTIKGNDFFVACTCPFFDEDLCKHIWATMLAAESRGFLDGGGQLPSRLRRSNARSHDEEDDEDGYDDDEEYEDDDYDDEYEEPIIAASPAARTEARKTETGAS